MSRIQRYRLTFEFLLRDRGDYQTVDQALRHALLQAVDKMPVSGIAGDLIGIEKIEEPK